MVWVGVGVQHLYKVSDSTDLETWDSWIKHNILYESYYKKSSNDHVNSYLDSKRRKKGIKICYQL